MLATLSRYWWLFALRGVFAILFSILAFVWPGLTVGALVILFGAYVLVDGVVTIFSAVTNRQENDRWWVSFLEGLVSIIAGIVTFVYPAMTAVLLLIFIAIWALITGIFEIIAAVRLRKEIENEWALALSGVASILIGVALIVNPGAGAVAVVWLIAIYAMLFGILMLYLAYKLRQAKPAEGRPVEAI